MIYLKFAHAVLEPLYVIFFIDNYPVIRHRIELLIASQYIKIQERELHMHLRIYLSVY